MTPEKRIERLYAKMNSIGAMLPGSISKQWNVCGNPGCACKLSNDPVKHGPYYQLSFSVKGRSSTMFTRCFRTNSIHTCIKDTAAAANLRCNASLVITVGVIIEN